MRDFDSIDSDDFLEDDDNELCTTGKCACIRQRSCIEKLFFVMLIIAFFVILGLILKSTSKNDQTGMTKTNYMA
jgi:hypothetical protein